MMYIHKFDVYSHVPSDVSTDQLFLNTQNIHMQKYLDNVTNWSNNNLMKINEKKSKFIFFNRSKSEFTTRLLVNNIPLERLSVIKLLGVWLQEDMGWEENTKQISIKSYSRIGILGKLKYAGLEIDTLLTIYKLFIRCIPEYCSTAFHTSLTEDQSYRIERIQANCLKVILGENYV